MILQTIKKNQAQNFPTLIPLVKISFLVYD